MADYTRADLKAALDKLPLERGDVVFCHSNIGLSGRCEGVTTSNELCDVFLDAINERLGPRGTLCVPAFTYSFPRREVFYEHKPVPEMGLLAEFVRRQSLATLRSTDPCYSVAAMGSKAAGLIFDATENSFDLEGSFFARFWRENGKVLNLNFDAGSTFVHHAERFLGVQYRFDKTFRGVVKLPSGAERTTTSTIWVRYLDDALIASFEAFDVLARRQRMFKTTRLGRGEMGVISAEDTYRLIRDTLPSRPWFLTKAEALGVTPDPARFSALR